MNRQKCIYCLEEKRFSKKKKDSEFNREHVLQNSLGKFGSETMTLIGKVCRSCNQLFGDTIDLALSRGGHDAVLRFKHGVKDISELKDFTGSNVEFTCNAPDNPEIHGVRGRLVEIDGELAVQPISQIGFKSKEHRSWIYFSEKEFDELVIIPVFLDQSKFKVFGSTDEDFERLWKKLEIRGFNPQFNAEVKDKPSSIVAETTFDLALQRALTKIAFNYFAKVTEDTDIIFNESFNETRRFIRYGLQSKQLVIKPSEIPILAEDTPERRQTNGHLVTVEGVRIDRKDCIIARVALFDDLIWDITLSSDYRGILFPLRSGHHWNFEQKTCIEMASLKRDLTLAGF